MQKYQFLYKFVLSLILTLVIIISSFYVLSIQSENIKNNIKIPENTHIQLMLFALQEELTGAASDLIKLAADDEIKNYIDSPTKSNLNRLIEEFARNLDMEKVYDKIVFIDEEGMEIIRVNYNEGNASIADKKDLRDKSDKYYFKNTIKLDKGEIYISPIDINVEHEKNEESHAPVVRFCVPLFNSEDQKRGIIVLSYLGDNISFLIGKRKHTMMLGEMMLIDPYGNFIISQNNQEKNFGFLFKDKESITFAEYYKEAWKVINKNNEGSVQTDKGLFTYHTLSSSDLMEIGITSRLNKTENLKWKIVSYISIDKLNQRYESYQNLIMGIDAILLVIIFFSSLLYLRFEKKIVRQQKLVRQSEEKFRTAFTTSPDSVTITNLSDGVFVNINDAFTKTFGYTSEEIIGKSSLENNIWVNPEDREKCVKVLKSKKQFNNYEAKFRKKNGEIIIGLMSAKIINIGGKDYSLSITRDITETIEANEKINILNSLYAVLSKGNASLLRTTTTSINYKEICKIIVEDGGFKMAWIGIIDEENMNVKVVASAGASKGYIEFVDIRIDESERSKGPAGTAIKTITNRVSNNILADSKMKPWHAKAIKIGFNSISCFPLVIFNKAVGVIAVYSEEINYFDDEKIDLLNELSSNISFAMEYGKIREEKLHAEKIQTLVHKIIEKSLVSDTLEGVIEGIHKMLSEILNVNNFSIVLYNPKNNLYSFPYIKDEYEKLDNDKEYSLENSLIDLVRKTGEPILADKEKFEILEQHEGIIINEPFQIWLGVPLKFNEEVFGVLTVHDYKESKTYTQKDLELLSLISTQISEVIVRKNTEAELETSELKYRSIIEAIPEAIISIDNSGRIIEWNKGAVDMFGFKKEEANGRNVTLIMPERYIEKHNIGFDAARKNHKLSKHAKGVLELEGRRKSGEIFPIEMTLSQWQIEDEIFFSANIRDVTLKKKYELEILKLSQVVEQSRVSIVITDKESNIEYVNQFFTELTGYTREEVLGKNPRILSSGEISKEIYRKMYSKISQGRIWYGEFHNRKKNGRLYWEEAIITPIKEINGNIINYCAIKVDITRRKRIESEIRKYRENLEKLVQERTVKLRKSEETFRALAENSRDTIIRFDINCKPIYINPILKEITGISVEGFMEKTPKELGFSNELIELFKNAVKKVFEEKETNRIEIMLPKGIWIDWLLVPEFDKKQNVTAVLGSGRDITEIKELELELNAALRNEKELSKLKSQFISTVSHEFRTPLTSIYSSIDLLELFGDIWELDKKKIQFDQIRGSIERLTDMLDDVLQISRMERGKMDVNFENISFVHFIESILVEIKPQLTERHKIVKNINILKNTYYLDKEVLRTVLLNLLSNAIKYSPSGGEIELKVKEEDNNLLFYIKDEGIGIREKDFENIFSEFYRTEETAYIEGTGLGLSIVKGLIDRIGGEISVSSKLGEGTIFRVSIPKRENKT